MIITKKDVNVTMPVYSPDEEMMDNNNGVQWQKITAGYVCGTQIVNYTKTPIGVLDHRNQLLVIQPTPYPPEMKGVVTNGSIAIMSVVADGDANCHDGLYYHSYKPSRDIDRHITVVERDAFENTSIAYIKDVDVVLIASPCSTDKKVLEPGEYAKDQHTYEHPYSFEGLTASISNRSMSNSSGVEVKVYDNHEEPKDFYIELGEDIIKVQTLYNRETFKYPDGYVSIKKYEPGKHPRTVNIPLISGYDGPMEYDEKTYNFGYDKEVIEKDIYERERDIAKRIPIKAHQSELQQLKDRHTQEVKDLKDRHTQDSRDIADRHSREIRDLKDHYSRETMRLEQEINNVTQKLDMANAHNDMIDRQMKFSHMENMYSSREAVADYGTRKADIAYRAEQWKSGSTIVSSVSKYALPAVATLATLLVGGLFLKSRTSS